MKKVLLSGLVLMSTLAFSQQQQFISFESAETYNLGNIDGQKTWTTTGTGAGNPNITNQVIVNTDAVAPGTNSLKITKESAFPGQTNPIVGAFYQIGTTIPHTNFTISFDVKLTDKSATASDFEFQTTGDGPTGGVYVIRLKFGSDGSIVAAQTTGTSSTFATTTGSWNANTWYRVKIVGTATGLTYYLNGTQIYTGNFFQTYAFKEIRFVHDNYLGSGFLDRLAINNESILATNDVQISANGILKIYPNPSTDYVILDTRNKIEKISVFDLNGKKMNVSNNENRVDVRSLPVGAYIISIETKDGKTSEKFIKQ